MAELDEASVVTPECLHELLDFFIKNAYKARAVDRRYEIIHKRCIHMVGRDYKIDIIDNKLGQLCAHYPSELIIIERELEEGEISPLGSKECVNDVPKIRELIPVARFARCRSRFVVPVILFENKNICRSSTLSSMAELYGRSGFDWILTLPTVGVDLEDRGHSSNDTPTTAPAATVANSTSVDSNSSESSSESEWVLLNKVRGQDVRLLKALGVRLICDLMVEKKKLKYGLYVCSSEKVDKWARYADFHIASMPYPGCEFFKDYKDNGYNAVALKFDWKQTFVDAVLKVPEDLEGAFEKPYKEYKDWDLIELTQNYLKMLLQYLVECEGGLLVHCISGWDRTPLYISLLRLSLWADGKVHRSLCPAEMLYFTLAYDWLIYGHQLKERHDKGEEVMYFCFDFLKYIVTDDFSILNRESKSARLKRTTPTTTRAMPTSSASTSMNESGKRGKARGSKLQGFDVNPNPPTASTYELGESWVGIENGSSSLPMSSHSPHPHTTTNVDSTSPLSPDFREHPNPGSSSPAPGDSPRAKKLNSVRELFLKTFRNSIPDTADNSSGGALAGLTGFFSKLASSVVNTSV